MRYTRESVLMPHQIYQLNRRDRVTFPTGGDNLHLLLKGAVLLERARSPLTRNPSWNILGWLSGPSALLESPFSSSDNRGYIKRMTALNGCEVACIPRVDVDNPETSRSLGIETGMLLPRAFNSDLLAVQNRLLLLQRKIEERLASVLISLSGAMSGPDMDRLTHEELAKIVAAHRVVVSGNLSKFREQGLIKPEGLNINGHQGIEGLIVIAYKPK